MSSCFISLLSELARIRRSGQLCPISISLAMGLLCHTYWLVSCPIPSCLLPFAQEEAGSALQVRDTLQQDPDTAPDNTVIRSKLLCR